MHEHMRVLVALQQADQRIRTLETEITALPKRVTAVEDQVKTAQCNLEANAAGQRAKEAERRRMESDITDLRGKIAKYRAQTDSVKTNEQYKALLHEIEFAEHEIATIETRELESLEQSEILEGEQSKLAEALASARKALADEQHYVRSAAEKLHTELASLRGTRSGFRSQAGDDWLARYDNLARTRRTAVAEVVDGECQACHMRLRPHQWNQLRAGEEMKCESCGRMLYYDEAHDTAVAAKAAGQWDVP